MNPVRTAQVAAVSVVTVAVECLGHFAATRSPHRRPLSYLALARKYRPRRFSEVSTQEHVSETLKRAVAGDRVGHAYLFCGPRGVGKTTVARILAMSLNCAGRTPEGEPCGRCDNCERIWGGHTSLDVVEIDAASNRGVEDARDLRQRAMYAPSEERRFKVYILDEAHMLTREAWNALLKILEEPPPRVIFCFATTEPRRIEQSASPILSRCQRFDFRRIGADDIVERLQQVLTAESIAFDREALRAIARKANGGMRDGLSLLDQVLALSDRKVTAESVVRVLGVVAEERYLEVFDLIIARRHAAVFDFVEALIDEGYDLVEFYHGLTEKLRLLLRMAVDPAATPGVMGAELRDAFAQRAAAFAPGDLVRMLAMCSSLEADGSLRRTGRPRVLVEVLLLRMSYLDRTVELEDVIRALGGAPAREPAPGTPSTAPVHRDAAPSAAPVQRDAAPSAAPVQRDTAPSAAPVLRDSPPSTSSAVPVEPERATPRSLAEGWAGLLHDGASLPRGLAGILRGAKVREDGESLVLEVQSGLAAEKLEDTSIRRRLEEGLALHAKRETARILVTSEPVDGSRKVERVTAQAVRRGRLQDLIERAPVIDRAVRELDLELVD